MKSLLKFKTSLIVHFDKISYDKQIILTYINKLKFLKTRPNFSKNIT